MTLTIYWPHQIYSENNKNDKWLLYLEDQPIIDNIRQSECTIASEYVNPLKLVSKNKANLMLDPIMAPASIMMRPTNKTQYMSRFSYVEKSAYLSNKESNSNNEQIINRIPRDTLNRIIRPERFMMNGGDGKGRTGEIVELNCNKNTASCIKIQCHLYNVLPKTEVYVRLRARLWNSTLVSEYPRADLVRIMSTASAKIPMKYNVEQLDANINVSIYFL